MRGKCLQDVALASIPGLWQEPQQQLQQHSNCFWATESALAMGNNSGPQRGPW